MCLFSEINTSDADARIQKHTKNCTTSFLFLDLWHTWVQYITKFARSPELYFFFRRHRVVTNTLKFVPLVPLNNIWLGLLAFVPKTRGPSKYKSILSMCCGEHLVNKINQLKSKISASLVVISHRRVILPNPWRWLLCLKVRRHLHCHDTSETWVTEKKKTMVHARPIQPIWKSHYPSVSSRFPFKVFTAER